VLTAGGLLGTDSRSRRRGSCHLDGGAIHEYFNPCASQFPMTITTDTKANTNRLNFNDFSMNFLIESGTFVENWNEHLKNIQKKECFFPTIVLMTLSYQTSSSFLASQRQDFLTF
jgi:hypothetical protein